jgi:uncharacterized repeat protein (TIGR01451 family)
MMLCIVVLLTAFGEQALGGQGITGIRATYETNPSTNDNYATLGPGGGGFDPATVFNIKFNITTQNNLRCDGFEVGTNEFSYILLADGINIARVDNPTPCTGSLHVILYEDNGYAAGTNIDLKSSYVSTMERSLLSVYVNRGSDNTFCNTGNGNGNNNNIERIDYLFTDGYPLHDNSSLRGFVIMDRGGNDQFQIAAITNLDATGHASGFGTPVTALATDWGWSGININTLVMRGYTEGGARQQPSAEVASQPLDGIYFTWQELGLVTGQVCYGYALVANDVTPAMSWTNPAGFPLNSTEAGAFGGLDLISGGSMFFDIRLNGVVGDFVWDDYNGNGIQDAGEPGLSNVLVRIYDTNGVFAGVTRTFSNGYYQVRGLATDNYYAKFYLPTNYFFSPANVGTNVEINSKADTNSGNTASFYLTVGTTNNLQDAGMHRAPTDLAVTKTVSTNRPNELDTIVYSILVTNKGPQTANLVQVTDTMPAGITYTSYGASQGTYTSGDGLWNIGTITNGFTARLTVTASVDSATAAWTITNTATITRMDRPDIIPTDNTSSVPLTVKSIDLGVTKTVDNSNPNTNDLVAYRIVLTNLGPDIATGVTVTDSVPAGVTYVSYGASSGAYSQVTGVWTVGTVAVHGYSTLTITGRVNAGTGGQSITNTASTRSSNQRDTNSLNNTSSAVINVVGADLAVSKTVNNAAPNEGGTIAYTIVVTNLGPSTATGVALSDSVPAGVTYGSYGASSGTYSQVTGIWTVGTLAVYGSATLTITGSVNAGTAGTAITNSAFVSRSNQPDPVMTNNTGTVVIAVSGLKVTKTSDASPYASPGSNITYTIVVSNSGATGHSGVNVEDYMPTGTTYVAGSTTVTVWQVTTNFSYSYTTTVVSHTVLDNFNTIAYTNQNGTTNWITDWQEVGEADGPTLNAIRVLNQWSANQLRILREVRSADRFADMGGYTNAVFSFDYRRILMDPADVVRIYASSNGGTAWTQIGTINGPAGGASDGATLSSNRNLTAFISDNVGIRFDVPVRLGAGEGIAFDNVQIQFNRTDVSTNVTTNVVSGIVTNAGGAPPTLATGYNLEAGRVLTVTFHGLVDNPISLGAITNIVSVTSDQQILPVHASVTNPVITTDVGVFKTVNNSTPWAGSNIVYTIVATNNGPGNATGLQITDRITNGITYVSHGTAAGTYTAASGLWNLGALALGGSARLTITASVNAGTAGTSITNTATITAMDQADTNPTNNTSSVIITIVGADIGVVKSVDESAPFVGNQVTYTMVASNNGPSAATGVALTDQLPAGVTYVSNAVSQGSYNNGSGVWTLGALPVGGNATLWLFALVNTNTSGWVITNRITITARDQPDPISANDTSTVTIAPQPPPLRITKVSNAGGLVDAGDTITYTITVTNVSPATQTVVTVTDPLPAGVTYVAASTVVTAPTNVAGNVLDSFGARSYGNDDGTEPWLADWLESEGDGPLVGNLRVEFDNVRGSTFTFHFAGSTNSVRRAADLSASTNAVLSFDYRRAALDAGDYVAVEISSNGTSGAWHELARLSGPAADADYLTTNFNITAYASTNTAIRFATTNTAMTAADIVWIDDVQFTFTRREMVSRPGDSPSTLASGLILYGGEYMTVTYQALVDNPPTAGFITNTASVVSTLMADPQYASVTDAVARADLAISKSVNNSTPSLGATIDYTIVLTNKGPYRALNVKLTDLLPGGLTYSNATPSSGTYDRVSGIWTVGTVVAYGSQTLVLRAVLTNDSSYSGIAITNWAYVTSSRTYDPVTTNHSASALITPKSTFALVTGFRGLNDGGVVAVEWTTEIEVGTAGFYVYRKGEADGGFLPVNAKLVPGQLTGPQGGTYRLRDPGAVPGKRYFYRVEEVEADGDRNLYGPYEVLVSGTAGAPQKAASTPAYTRQARAVSDSRKARNAARVTELVAARGARAALMGNLVKIGVKEPGVYCVGTAQLAAVLNLPVESMARLITLRQLQLKNRGEDVNYLVSGTGKGLYFYGEALSSIYADENAYWLSFGSSQRVGNQGGGTPLATAQEGSFRQVSHSETNRIAVPAIFTDPEADIWMWEYLVAGDPALGTNTFPVKTAGAVSDGLATLCVKLKGYTKTGVTGEHHASVKVNGTVVGEGRWTGMDAYELWVTFAQDILRDGDNAIEVSALLDTGAPYSVFYVDSLDVDYKRYYRAVNNELEANGGTNRVMTIGGFANSKVVVLNVTNPKRIAMVAGTRIEPSGGGWRVSFRPATATAKYLACTPAAAKTPASVLAVIPTALTSAGNQGQYVVIAPRELKATAQVLADYRAAQGYKAKVVDLEAIYDVFNYGIASPFAIQQFLRYAYRYWAMSPEYVVLIGEGSFDYKDYLGYADCVVPTKMVNTPFGLFESDTYFADVAGDDGVPEMAVGRLPVMTADELTMLISKIETYEAGDGDWVRQVLFAADNPDEGGRFPEDSDEVGQWVPGGFVKQRIYLDEQPIGDARTAIQNGINNGASLMNYIGHGALSQLAQEGLLTTADVPGLNNGAKLPVVLALTCVVGRYGVPGFDCLGEALLMKSGGGAIGVWAPTGLSMNDAALQLDNAFFQSRFADGEMIVGDAVLSALEDYGAIGFERYMLEIYNLLGDPALRMK